MLLQNGRIFNLKLNKEKLSQESESKVEGDIVSFAEDIENGKILYIVTKVAQGSNSTVKLYAFAQGELKDISESVKAQAQEVAIDSNIIPLFSPEDNTQVVIMSQ